MKNKLTWRYFAPAAIFLTGTIFAIIAENKAKVTNEHAIELAVDATLGQISIDVVSAINQYYEGLRGLLAAIEATGIEKFNYQSQLRYSLSRQYEAAFPGSMGFGVIKKVTQKNLATFLASVEQDRQRPFTLKQLDEPANPLFIIQYIEPEINNANAVGLDIGSESHRRQAALKAAASRSAQLTAPITLVQAHQQAKHGFLLLYPIFKGPVKQPFEELFGWVYSPLLIGKVLDSVKLDDGVTIDISDTTTQQAIHFYSSAADNSPTVNAGMSSQTVSVFGRQWSISLLPSPLFIESLGLEDPTIVFWRSMAVTMLLALLAFFLVNYIFQRLFEIRQKAELATVVNNSTDGIVGLNKHFAIAHWNNTAGKLFGYTKENALKKPLAHWLSTCLSSMQLINLFKQVANGEAVRQIEIKYNSEYFSEERLLSISIAPIIEQDDFIGATVSIHDVTELKGLQQELVETNQLLENKIATVTSKFKRQLMFESDIIDSMQAAVIACDKAGNIHFFNNAASSLYGYGADEITNSQNILTLLDVESLSLEGKSEQLADNFLLWIEQQSSFPNQIKIDCYCKLKSGEHLPLQWIVTPILVRGELEGFVFTNEPNLIQRHLTLADTAVENSHDVLLWLNLDGNVINCNPYANVVLSVKGRSLKHFNIKDFIVCEESEPWDVIYSRIMTEHRLTFEASYRTIDNVLVPVLISGCVIDTNQEPCIYLAAKDISERLEKQKLIESALEKADLANRIKTEFIANMSHELRTPLNAVNGYFQLLEQSQLDEIQRKYVVDGQLSVSVLTQIVEDILDVTNLEKNGIELDEEDFELDDVLSEIGAQLSVMVGSKPVEVHFYVAADVPYFLYGDRNKLMRILINIAGNAVKFTYEGEIVLSISREMLEDSNDVKLKVSIKDTGIGIKPEQLTQIFNVFTQADNSNTRIYGGLGIGLTISSQYVKLMQGNIEVESQVGSGSEFRFDLLLKPADALECQQIEKRLERPINVLIVDDNVTSLTILENMIEQLGWKSTTTTSAYEALNLLENAFDGQKQFDLALIDWKMPAMDGWELAKTIKQREPNKQVPLLIMVTAHSQQILVEEYDHYLHLLNGFLTKPVTRTQMMDAFLDAATAAQHTALSNGLKSKDNALLDQRVLVVEDNPTNQEIVTGLLESQGANTTVAIGGKQALEELTNSLLPFDVVLMDIQMPGIDGYETTRRIKAIDKFKMLPIIAMTANVTPADKAKCLAVGMNGHIGKPFSLVDLVHQILTVTDNRKRVKKLTASHTDERIELSDEIIEYCRKENICINDALEGFNYLSNVYLRSLGLFYKDLQSYLKQMSCQDKTLEQLTLMFHTLKSSASSLGFKPLATLAKLAEQELKEKPDLNDVSHTEFEVVELMKRTLVQVTELSEKLSLFEEDESTPVASEEDFLPIFKRLVEEVSSFNMHAIDTFQEISLQLKSMSPDRAGELIDALNVLKFKEAKETLKQFEQQIQVEENNAS
ncbi:response regulator [Motilimonas sp. 1_MG-2023]|uniref:response regulator n=1 Tax=Motilimonas sp. 1_MG-2023 TaxID=3062672 RepID=UPI0026E30EEE|nr:response regulator [Motilimonas sp. 1_MG-2023]MDO6525559.1 response regulator [Motilimonas sp. 1_MG-2023]